MEFRRPGTRDLPGIVAAIARDQAQAHHHIAYLDLDPDAIASQLTALEPAGLDGAIAAFEAARLAGFLAAEWDDDPPRVWWHGPFVFDRPEGAADGEVAWQAAADALYERAMSMVPATVTQEEFAGDTRHEALDAFARRHGFAAEEASVVVTRHLDHPTTPARLVDATVGALHETDRAPVAAMHDRLFPGSHVPGHRLDDGRDRVVLVARDGDRVVGYVAAERQDAGSGYLDLLGVDEVERGRGIGGLLVTAACELVSDRFGCRRVHLTVREGNTAARRLYERLDFREERLLRPHRRGFSLA